MLCWVSDLLDFAKFTANPKSFSHFMHSMLGLRLSWWCFNKHVDKFSECHVRSPTCLASQNLSHTQNPFLHFVHSMLGLRLAWWCFNNVCIKFLESHVGSPTCLTLQSILEILLFFSTKIAHYWRSL